MNSGNITKKTRKQLADDLKISVKTMRESLRYVENMERIEANIGAEKAKQFNDIVASLQPNKKENVSAEQIKQLSMLSSNEQIRIVDLIISHPKNAKRIINHAIPYCKVKTTVTLPLFVSEWYEIEADKLNMSKNQYITELLMGLYKNGVVMENKYIGT